MVQKFVQSTHYKFIKKYNIDFVREPVVYWWLRRNEKMQVVYHHHITDVGYGILMLSSKLDSSHNYEVT